MGIDIETCTDRLCNHVSGHSSRESQEVVSLKMDFNPSECLCGHGLMNVRASETSSTIPSLGFHLMQDVCLIKIPDTNKQIHNMMCVK